jgi:hypothetical protein
MLLRLLSALTVAAGVQGIALGSASYTLVNGNTNSFTVNYAGTNISTVSATVVFTPMAWSYSSGVSTFELLMLVDNTSNPSSRLSGLGFLTTPPTFKKKKADDPNFSVMIVDHIAGGGLGNELFGTVDIPSQMPGGVDVDFCITAGTSCTGGGGGGLFSADPAKESKIKITYSGQSDFVFDKFYARYQTVCQSSTDTACNGSDYGQGRVTDTVPEPGFYGLLAAGMAGLAVLSRRKRAR